MLVEFFVFGGFWFWALIAAFVVAEISCVHNSRPYMGTFLVFGLIAMLSFFGQFGEILSSMIANPVETGLWILGYLAIGVVWSFVKWGRHVSKLVKEFTVVKDEVLEKHNVTNIKDLPAKIELDSKTMTWDARHPKGYLDNRYNSFKETRLAAKNKERITTWILFWVFSAVWDCFETLTFDLADVLFNTFKGWYAKVSDRLTKGIDEEFAGFDAQETPVENSEQNLLNEG